MRLVDADLMWEIIRQMKEKYLKNLAESNKLEYLQTEFQICMEVFNELRACTCPTYTVIQAKSNDWIPCEKELPEKGVNVILTFKDTFHTHPSWPKIQVLPAWICNVDDDNPKGQWAIEGRLGNYVINIDDGIAWKPLPEPYKGDEDAD